MARNRRDGAGGSLSDALHGVRLLWNLTAHAPCSPLLPGLRKRKFSRGRLLAYLVVSNERLGSAKSRRSNKSSICESMTCLAFAAEFNWFCTRSGLRDDAQ